MNIFNLISVFYIRLLLQECQSLTMQYLFGVGHYVLDGYVSYNQCRSMGFWFPAVLRSPEELDYVVQMLQQKSSDGEYWVGLRYDPYKRDVTWYDGTTPAPDLPWSKNTYMPVNLETCVILNTTKRHLASLWCGYKRKFVCGNKETDFKKAVGKTHNNMMPAGVSSSSTKYQVESYMRCVTLCAQRPECRAAWLNSISMDCVLLNSTEYTGLQSNQNAKTFLREGYT